MRYAVSHRFAFFAAGLILLAGLLSCQPDGPTEPAITGVSLARGGPGPNVQEADPPSAPQDITLDVRVLGSGFDDGSEATWTLDGVPQPEVRTNATRFVSGNELVANITIDPDAPIELYDVEVVTLRGKKGIGADLFAVLKKGTVTYSVIELPPHSGADGSSADGLNEVGQIVGSSNGLNEPTLWTVDEASGEVTVTPLEMDPSWFYAAPAAISDNGLAVGVFGPEGDPNDRAVAWDVSTTSANGLPLTGTTSRAHDVATVDGQTIVVGQQDRDAVYWVNGSAPVTLPPISEGALARAKAINANGTIAGESDLQAVVWYRDPVNGYGEPCLLEPNSLVYGMSEPNEDGHVHVAGRWNVSVDGRGAVWKVDPSTCIQDEPPRHLDFLSRFNDVNSAGEAVGEDAQKHAAIVWTSDGQLIELPGLGKGKGAGGVRAEAISSDGKRVVGTTAVKGKARAALWIKN